MSVSSARRRLSHNDCHLRRQASLIRPLPSVTASVPARPHSVVRARTDVAALAALPVAAALFVVAYDGGGYALTSRASFGVALWWLLFLLLAFGLVRFSALSRPALAVGASLALLAALTLASTAWAPSAETALVEFNRVTLYLGTFLLVILLRPLIRAAAWLDGIALAISAVCAVALVSRFFPGAFGLRRLPEILPSSLNRLSFPVDYWNGLGILAGLAAAPLLRLAVNAASPVVRGLALVPIPALAATVMLTSSRGGILAAVAAVVVFMALTRRRWPGFGAVVVAGAGSLAAIAVLLTRDELVSGPLGDPAVPGQGRSAAVLIALACVACGLVYGAAVSMMPTGLRPPRALGWALTAAAVVATVVGAIAADPVTRFDEFKSAPDVALLRDPDFIRLHLVSGNGTGRWQIWSSAVDAFQHEPLHGIGAGSFERWWAAHGSLAMFVRDAHSLYLEMLAELGLPGLLLIGTVLLVGIVAGIRRTLLGGDHDCGAAATAVVVAFAFAAGVDWMWELTIVSLVAVIALALATGRTTEPSRPPAYRGALAVTAVIAAIALAAVAGQGIALLTTVNVEDSRDAVVRGDLVAALRAADAASRIQPWAASPYAQRALVEEQALAFGRARGSIERAIDRDDTDWRLWLIRARIETELGKADAARRSLLRAAALNPRSPLFSDLPPAGQE